MKVILIAASLAFIATVSCFDDGNEMDQANLELAACPGSAEPIRGFLFDPERGCFPFDQDSLVFMGCLTPGTLPPLNDG